VEPAGTILENKTGAWRSRAQARKEISKE